MLVYRLARDSYAEDLSGEGARLFGGRWNRSGTPCVYGSLNRSLAILELAVNLEIGALMPSLCMVTVEIPVKKLRSWPLESLPQGWANIPVTGASQDFGTAWLLEAKELAVCVPSVLVPEEWNVVINPAHPGAGELRIVESRPFSLDARLL